MTGSNGSKRSAEEDPTESTPSKRSCPPCPCGQDVGSHKRVLIDTTVADGDIKEDTPTNACLVIITEIGKAENDEEPQLRCDRELYVKKFFKSPVDQFQWLLFIQQDIEDNLEKNITLVSKLRLIFDHLPEEIECRAIVCRSSGADLEFPVREVTLLRLGQLSSLFKVVEVFVKNTEAILPHRVTNVDEALRHYTGGFLKFINDLEEGQRYKIKLDIVLLEHQRVNPTKKPRLQLVPPSGSPHRSTASEEERYDTEAILNISQEVKHVTPVSRDSEGTRGHGVEGKKIGEELVSEWENPHTVKDLTPVPTGDARSVHKKHVPHKAYTSGLVLFESDKTFNDFVLVSFRNCSFIDIKSFSGTSLSNAELSASKKHCEVFINDYILERFNAENGKDWRVRVILTKVPCRDCFRFFLKGTEVSWSKLFNSIALAVWDEEGRWDDDQQTRERREERNRETLRMINHAEGGAEDGSITASYFKDLDEKERLKVETLCSRSESQVKVHDALQSAQKERRTTDRPRNAGTARRSLAF